ncbi:hypothetical protein Q1695_015260 [Nippostrongylus brasiliensis]|nr:hypothetical protein Q1695_015260 [Nippostrongylus brasiliensis]
MGVIQRLPEDVVNRIAAGEVVVRPANAVKELIENSLDAGATEIVVTIKDGGLSLLQVQDNGKGIEKDDLDIVCERFTTSKLSKFEDLQSMRTYGFRGEALSSISHVAKVTITSKTASQQCAYQAKYIDGKAESIKASAGLNGTCIAAEDLFYNCPNRKKAFRNHSEETSRVADIITRYAVHRPDISFAMRRGGCGADFRTSGRATRGDIITALLGKDCGENMIEFTHSSKRLYYDADVCLTSPLSASTARSVQGKKNRQKSFFLFINGRVVQSSQLKFAVDSLFGDRDLVCSFVLISLTISPSRIDVNVHPTKQTVLFLEEEAIIEDLCKAIEHQLKDIFGPEIAPRSLSNCNQELPTSTQIQRIPSQTQSVVVPNCRSTVDTSKEEMRSPLAVKKRVDYAQVRVDHRERRLDEFLSGSSASASSSSVEMVQVVGSQDDSCPNVEGQRVFEFESLLTLRKSICDSASQTLRELFKTLTFVGCVSATSMLIQFGTGLYIVQLDKVLNELFYQMLVFGFGNLGSFKLDGGANILELLQLAGLESDNEIEALQLLNSNAPMLNDYFCIEIQRPDGDDDLRKMCLTCVPSIIDGYTPQLEGLPALLLGLVQNVNWEEEKDCFQCICHVVADFFTIKEEFCDSDLLSGFEDCKLPWLTVVRDLLVPRIKSQLVPPESLKSGIRRLADLHDLYKVFERC